MLKYNYLWESSQLVTASRFRTERYGLRMISFINVRYVWTIKNFQQQLNISSSSSPNQSARIIESPVFFYSGTANDVNKWKCWVEANRIADPSISYTNGQDFFLTIRVRNQFLKTSSTGIYCKVEILSKDKKCVFTALSQTTARGIYSNITTFQLHRMCNISELERHNPDLFCNGSLALVLSLGPLQTLDDESATAQLVRLQVNSIAKDTALLEPLKSMWENGILTDVVVRTKEKDFRCHKIILASSSKMFQAMFETEMKESVNNVVDLRNVFEAETMKNVLHYMYTKQAPPKLGDDALHLLSAADYFQLDLLKRLCVQILCKNINVKNAADILQLAEKYNIELLQKVAVKFIVENSKQVVVTSSWKSIPSEMSKYLLSTFLLAVADRKTSNQI